jgi:hypothetical protein
MGQLSLTLLRLGFLGLLWAFVLTAVAVLRADIYGTRVIARGRGLTRRSRSGTPRTAITPTRVRMNVRTGAREKVAEASSLHLAIIAGPLEGTTIPLGVAPVTIGRAPTSTLVVDDDFCSARHARLYREADVWWVEDLGSTNGTFLDDARLYDPVEVKPGARLRFGATILEVRD